MVCVCRVIAQEAVTNTCKKYIEYEGVYFCVGLNCTQDKKGTFLHKTNMVD